MFWASSYACVRACAGLFMALQPRIIACGNRVATFAMAVRFLAGPAVMAASSIAVGLRGNLLHVAVVQVSLSLTQSVEHLTCAAPERPSWSLSSFLGLFLIIIIIISVFFKKKISGRAPSRHCPLRLRQGVQRAPRHTQHRVSTFKKARTSFAVSGIVCLHCRFPFVCACAQRL